MVAKEKGSSRNDLNNIAEIQNFHVRDWMLASKKSFFLKL